MDELLHRIKSRTVEVGDCWIWQGSCNSAGHPLMSYRCYPHLVRRLAYQASGRALRNGYVIHPTCRERKCCNPEHLVAITCSERNRRIYAEQRKNIALMAHKMSQRAMKFGFAKLTLDQVRAIRDSTESHAALAERYGVSHSAIRNIRRGKSWREIGNSVFSWRPS